MRLRHGNDRPKCGVEAAGLSINYIDRFLGDVRSTKCVLCWSLVDKGANRRGSQFRTKKLGCRE